MEIENEIELRSEEVNEILTDVPGWMLRWGITIIFSILLLAIILAGFISYPDIVNAQVTITSTQPAVNLVARSSGKIIKLFVQDNQLVSVNAPLALIENTAVYEDVLTLKKMIEQRNSNITTNIPLPKLKTELQLGEIQNSYNNYIKAIKDYNLFFELNPQLKEIGILSQQLEQYNELNTKEQKQLDIFKEELDLVEKDYNRSQTLFSNQSISAKELEDKKREYLQAKRNYESMRITISNSEINTSNLQKNLLQLRVQGSQQDQQVKQSYEDAKQTLENVVKVWEQNYLIQSPIAGKVSFFDFWSNNQNIKTGDEVMSILPSGKSRIFGKSIMPVANSGKVKVGQKIYVRLTNFPYQEFGVLTGKIAAISVVPKQNNYSIEVELPESLITNYNKTIPYQPEMKGTAEIVTENLSLLDRVFYQMRKLLVRK